MKRAAPLRFGNLFRKAIFAALACCTACSSEKAVTPTVIGAIDANPDWSSAGDRVVFFSYTDSLGNFGPGGLYITDSAGNGKTRVPGFGYCAKWTDGDSVLIVNDGEHIFSRNLRDSTGVDFGLKPASPVFNLSDDGRYVYYNGAALDSANSSGTYRFDRVQELVSRVCDGGHADVSPDGTQLVYARGYLYLFSLADSSIRQLTTGLGQLPRWARDGTTIIFDGTWGQLLKVTPTGVTSPFINGYGMMSQSPDGDRLLFIGPTPDPNGYQHIWEYRFSNGTIRQFTH